MKRCLLFGLFLLNSVSLFAQGAINAKTRKEKKGELYFAFGSQRIFYTPSDIRVIHANNPSFDFTLYKVKGKDEGGLDFSQAPQFSYTVGYYFKEKNWGFEYHYDHIKYFTKQFQVVRLKGVINGKTYDTDTLLVDDFFRLEHSDGANYGMFNFVKWLPIKGWKASNPPQILLKAGIGFVNPKTNSYIMGNIRDDKYYLSGYVAGLESGLRVHLGKYVFATGSFKGCFANYSHFLISGGYGKQKWFSGAFNYMVGAQFPL